MEVKDFKRSDTVHFIETLSELKDLIKKALDDRPPMFNGERYLTNKDLSAVLHLSERSLQDYRDRGKIPFIQISGKILYKESDVMKLLEDNYVSRISLNI